MHRDEDGVAAVLGAVLMLALMMTMVPGAMLLRTAVVDEMAAHREAAERAAFCARNPEVAPPACPEQGPLPGYSCDPVAGGTWLCRPTEDASLENLTAPPPVERGDD